MTGNRHIGTLNFLKKFFANFLIFKIFHFVEDAGPLLEYYSPLIQWIDNINSNEQRVVGWEVEGEGEAFAELIHFIL